MVKSLLKFVPKLAFCLLCLLCVGLGASAQGMQKSPEEREKELYELIQKEVEKYEEALDLEIWQSFYADSILTHNYKAIDAEFKALSEAKVSNPDLYMNVQDKWMEASYQAFHKILDDKQWEKYLKMGAARDKKQRDKRLKKTQ